MSTSRGKSFRKLAVIGAGNMGSGIAQKMATEGFDVTLVDLDEQKVRRGLGIIKETLDAGVERKIFKPDQAKGILSRIGGSWNWKDLADVDLVVEAVFEDPEVKRQVFERLDAVCSESAVLATNTSSLSVTRLAEATRHPERVIGLHYFYHPAKNRLVEVVPGRKTDPDALESAWALQEQMGKTPIASKDVFGFVVNRYFVPWLNESVRLLEDGVADIPTIEAACKKTFGVGMGPFELMNVTGIPIALHSATTLGQEFGPFYAPCERLASQVASNDPWPLDGKPDSSKFDAVSEHMLAVIFYVAGALVDEEVGTIEDTDIGARVGLRWPRGPFQLINRYGVERAAELVKTLAGQRDLKMPAILAEQAASGKAFRFELVKSETKDGIATLTINRPDAMNALNEAVVSQLHGAFRAAENDPAVRGIVIAGAGKAFIAGADIRFFVRNIDSGDLERIVGFTRDGHALLNDIDRCEKPVVARLHGLALGGGLELALACHHLIASPKASFAFPETGIGIYPGLGGTQRAPRRVGKGLAKWLIYSGEILGADKAASIGLVDSVVPHEQIDDAVRQAIDSPAPRRQPAAPPDAFADLAGLFEDAKVEDLRTGQAETGGDERLARTMKKVGFKAPIALSLAEKLIDRGTAGSLEDGLELELAHLTEIFRSADAYEGLSTLGKRRPVWKGE